jgi:hypothetical protein
MVGRIDSLAGLAGTRLLVAEAFYPDEINPAAGGAFAAAVKSAVTFGKLTYLPFPELVKPKVR